MPESATREVPADFDPEVLREAESLSEGLYPHQIEGIAFLLGRRRAILADDMGLGKTRQSVLALHHAESNGPYLVVCPATVKLNWEREILIVLPRAQTAIVGPAPPPEPGFAGWIIVNYDILGKHLEALRQHGWSGAVFDEAHYLKNHRSQRHRYARDLMERTPDETVVHMLTGTPLTNRPRDLFPLLQLADHPLGRSFLSFAKRYCDAYKNDYGWVSDGASNIEELTVQLHGIMLRRTKEKVLDLPPKMRTWLKVEVASRAAQGLSRAVMGMLAQMSRRHGGLDPLEGESPEEHRSRQGHVMGQLTTARNRLAIGKVRNTIPFVEDIDAQGEKAIVFSCFIRPVELLQKRFGKRAVSIVGSTPAARRQILADRFQNDDEVQVLAANITAGGIGLNLTAARQVNATYRQVHASEFGRGETEQVPRSDDAIAILARVLAGPHQQGYRAESSSKKGAFYELEVVGSDISCSCKGFSYRGSCQHARALKQALVAGEKPPAGFARMED